MYIYIYHLICVYKCIYHIMCVYNCIYENIYTHTHIYMIFLDHSQLGSMWYNWSVYTTSSKPETCWHCPQGGAGGAPSYNSYKLAKFHSSIIDPGYHPWPVLTRATLDPPGHLRKELLISSAGDIWRAASNILLGTAVIILGWCYTTIYSWKMMKITDYLYNLVYTQHSGGQVCGQKGTNSKVTIEWMNRSQKRLRFNI